jgi:hypothetical protein
MRLEPIHLDDTQNRLTRSTMFADDMQVIKVVMSITYYK